MSASPIYTSTNIDYISPAIAITDNELACFHFVHHILQSHKNLTLDDIHYASNYISSFYSYSLNTPISSPPLLDDTQLIMFLVYSDQNGICKFALIFNEELDTAIKSRDDILLKRLLLGPKEMFIELYDNAFLSSEERDFIIRLISRESFAIMLSIELFKNNPFDINSNNTSSICYDQVCFQDAKILDDDYVRATMSKYEKPSSSVFTIDKSPYSNTPNIYCFDTLDLISSVTEPLPINPKTNQPFSSYSLNLINQRFHKEIAMYRRYRQLKSNIY